MKKFLLIAAMAALALGATADGYKLEKVWENTDVASLYLSGCRQGFGMDGKFYINDMRYNAGDTDYTIYIYGENGLEGTIPGYANAAITHDEAGNLVVMNNTGFAAHTNDDPWAIGASILVLNPETQESKEYQIPEDALLSGRCDFLGFPKGDLMEDGQIFLTGGLNTTVFSVITITGGELDKDECYRVNNDLVTASTSTVINYYTDVNGEESLLYVTRNAQLVKIPLDDLSGGAKVVFPHKGACNGAFPFVWDGMELCVYPILPNYQNGFAVGEAGASEPIVEVASTVSGNANGFQANWLNAEVDENGVTIYQYYPGGHITVWRLTKEEPVYTVASNILNDWAISEENNMVMGEDGIYTLTKDNVEIAGGTTIEYKVTSNGTWWPAEFNAEYYIGEDGLYNLVFTFNPDGGIVGIQVTKQEDPQPEMIYTVVGPAHVFGTEWDPTDVNNDMVKGEDGIYTLTKQNVQLDDFFGFKIVGNHSWDEFEWPIGYENNWNAYLPDGAGVYDIVITFDPAQADEKITCTLTKHSFLRGDVDMSGDVKIGDVTALISYLLSGDATEVNLQAADCDQSGDIKIGDVTALISYLLSGTWDE
jgi:hypothetical protein